MSKDYDPTNTGALFKNDRKTKESQPGYKGSLNVEGVDYWVSAWVKESRAGQKYFSIALTKKEEESRPAPPAEDDSDDIPF